MRTARVAALARAALPILAILSFIGSVAPTLLAAGPTLGFDFLAYHQAAVRVLHGQPLYDMSFVATGGFGLFYYPPTFVPMILPLGLLAAQAATWVWIGLLLVAFVVGVSVLPVSQTVRWWMLLLAGLSFPFVYALKLGQVGPMLFLTFAAGWRWIDRPALLGASAAVGSAVKLQPGVVLIWALLTRRWTAVLLGAIALGVLVIAAILLTGLDAWCDFLTLVRTVSDPITTPHNFTPGAIAYQLGLAAGSAALIQLLSTVAAILALLAAIRWCSDEASYLVAAIVSQLISPVLWDHYAMLLLLPVAYLLSAGRWWALAIPLVSAWPLVGITPSVAYPIAFWLTLMAVVAVGRQARLGARS